MISSNNIIMRLDILLNCGIINITLPAAIKGVQMTNAQPANSKEKALRESNTLNSHPVSDALFSNNEFFDSRDLVQVKYEMLRKVNTEGEPVAPTAASFGFSRPSFYKTLEDFTREGITGLLPRKRGPRNGHKLTTEILAFIQELCAADPALGIPALLTAVEQRFGLRVHRRSLERALKRQEKKTPQLTRGTR